jgi:hypothetical protein
MVGAVFPEGSKLKVIDHGRQAAGCGSSWFSQDPPPGVNGAAKLADFTVTPGSAPSGSIAFDLAEATLAKSSGTHPFVAYGATVDVIDCPSTDASPTIGFAELLGLLGAWQSSQGDNSWNAVLDFTRDERIDFSDFLVLLAYWNAECPA